MRRHGHGELSFETGAKRQRTGAVQNLAEYSRRSRAEVTLRFVSSDLRVVTSAAMIEGFGLRLCSGALSEEQELKQPMWLAGSSRSCWSGWVQEPAKRMSEDLDLRRLVFRQDGICWEVHDHGGGFAQSVITLRKRGRLFVRERNVA